MMYEETKQTVTGRIERMRQRYNNARQPIDAECSAAIDRINNCASVEEALAVESSLLSACEEKFPTDWAGILSDLNLYEQHYDHETFLDRCGAQPADNTKKEPSTI